MPGARPRNLRLGDRSELLVEQLLASFAFTTRVPRQEDHGIDFFCNLISDEAQLLKAGPFFTVQAKSSTDPVVYEKSYELEWIKNQENPLMLCVADRAALAMDVYSTWNLVCAVLAGWRGQSQASRIVLLPGAGPDIWPGVVDKDDGYQEIRLGKPIARIGDDDVFNDVRMESIAKVIQEWVSLDRANIINRYAGMYWALGPLAYQTNEPPSASGHWGAAFYFHPDNLPLCSANLGRVATALTFILRNPQAGLDLTQPPWSMRISALQELLRLYWDVFDEPVRQFLTNQHMNP